MDKKFLVNELKAAMLNVSPDCIIDGWEAIKSFQIKIPSIDKKGSDMHYVIKSLYMAACKRRDFNGEGKTPLWQGIEIPGQYWPHVGQKRIAEPTATITKPLFKVAVGSAIKEFNKDLPTCKADVLAWVGSMVNEKLAEYETAKFNMAANKEYQELLSVVKSFVSLPVDNETKIQMITPLLLSKGYKNPDALACNLLGFASKQESIKKNIDLLVKE